MNSYCVFSPLPSKHHILKSLALPYTWQWKMCTCSAPHLHTRSTQPHSHASWSWEEGMLSIQQLTAFLFIGNIKFYIPCSVHGRKKWEHTLESITQGVLSSQCSSKLRKLQKTEKEKMQRIEKGITQKLEGRTKRRKPYLVWWLNLAEGDQAAQGCLSLGWDQQEIIQEEREEGQKSNTASALTCNKTQLICQTRK